MDIKVFFYFVNDNLGMNFCDKDLYNYVLSVKLGGLYNATVHTVCGVELETRTRIGWPFTGLSLTSTLKLYSELVPASWVMVQ